MTISLVEVSPLWLGTTAQNANVTVASTGEHLSLISFHGDAASNPDVSSSPFTVTVDGNAATRLTNTENSHVSSQLTTGFAYGGSLSSGSITCSIAWSDGNTRQGFNVLLRGSTGALSVNASGVIFEGLWTADVTGTISGLQSGDVIVFFSCINGGSSTLSDNTTNVSVTNDDGGLSAVQSVGIATSAGPSFAYDFSQAGGSQRSCLSYAVIREATGGGGGSVHFSIDPRKRGRAVL